MNNQYLQELNLLETKPYMDQKNFRLFADFIRSSENIVKTENPEFHICSFFVPVHISSRSLFLVHHIKANDWIPPGGHIEKNEHPKQTVYREYQEELGMPIGKNSVELFDVSITKINNKHIPCKQHFDFWYLVFCETKEPFYYLKEEFYDANWFFIGDCLKKTRHPSAHAVLSKFNSYVFSRPN